MTVTEIFTSIQGESTLQGLPCLFIRLTGCNLDCRWCDTPYARGGGTVMSIEDIVGKAREILPRHACITGGEPLLQAETPDLVRALVRNGFRVSIETNGSLDISRVPTGAVRVIDIKCPSSGESGTTHPSVFEDRRPGDEYKFVLAGREDFEYSLDFIRSHGLARGNTALLSPVTGSLDPALLAAWIVEEAPETRLNLQMHRFIWPGESRGR